MTVTLDDLPKSIRVGPHEYKFGKLSARDAEDNYGQHDPDNQVIELLSDGYASGSRAVEIIIHELLHAIFDVGKIDPKGEEEPIVYMMGILLTQVIRDNPELMVWIQKTVTK
jgi:hypothetical protein